MDKFVVRIPKEAQEKQANKTKCPKLKQTTIKSLARVVVVEDIFSLKSALELHKNDGIPDKLLEILDKLKDMNPSKAVLLQTKIGQVVNSLQKCQHVSVKQLSKDIVKKWKGLVKEECREKEIIDVRCDTRTELLRCKARKMIADVLQIKLPNSWISETEKQLFHQCRHRISNEYKRKVRQFVFSLKKDDVLMGKIKEGSVSSREFLAKYLLDSR